MSRVHFVTDSSATFEDPRFVEDYGVTVIPLAFNVEGRRLQDGIDFDAEEMLRILRQTNKPPALIPPSVGQFEEIYHQVSKETDQICVLLHSQHFSEAYANAQTARASLLGRCEIAVVDSRTTSAGLGYLVETVVETSATTHDLDEIVQTAREAISRIYSIFFVDTLSFIQRAGLLGQTQAMLGTMLDIKPLLTIEDGELMTMEKARTHAQAIDKMVEFVTEFTDIERLGILQNTLRITDLTRMLQDRLALEFSRLQAPVMLYSPLIASRIGPDAMGIVVLEGSSFDEDMF